MGNLETLRSTKNQSSAVRENMQHVLSNTYGLYLATHNYHWNVEGSNFVALHQLFGEQYNQIFEAIDVIAERIRALGSYALPFESDEILTIMRTSSNATNKETDVNLRANRMVHNLIDMSEKVIESCQSVKRMAQESKDDESENLMVERITYHQKAMWMLKSIIK